MKKTKEVEFEYLEITREVAKEMLAASAPNRRISEHTVAERMRAFLDGKWRFNGAPIRFNQEGQLIDGRHRLTGYLAACQVDDTLPPFHSLVVYGIEEDAMTTIDTGRIRSLRDHLTIHGKANVHVLSAVIRKLAYFAYDQTDRVKLSIDEAISMLERHPNITLSVKRCQPIEIVPRSTLGAIHYIGAYYQNAEEAANGYLNVFRTGRPGYEGCPAHRIREYFIKIRSEKRMLIDQELAKILVWGWNCYRDGKAISYIRPPETVTLTGWTPEICFGKGNILALQASETNAIARKVAGDIMGGRPGGSSYLRARRKISQELDEEQFRLANLVGDEEK